MSQYFFLILSILLLNIHNIQAEGLNRTRVVNVDDFRARRNGSIDDNEAFVKAWKETCSSSISSVFMVPQNREYLLKPINFSGPCKSNVKFLIKGRIEASLNPSNWNEYDPRHWIVFDNIKKLVVTGGGIINGNGRIWWQNSCKKNEALPCTGAPTALTFSACKRLRVENLRIKDSQQMHVVIEKSKKVVVSKLLIKAPEKSPNTDGIHVTHSENVIIRNCKIRTGDDCVSIVSGSKNIEVRNITCGPGHGISIGSLGKYNTKAHVRNVVVDTAILNGTTNGVRIKTWQGGRGYAKSITFQNINMHNVKNPVIITQNYCDSKIPCHEQHRAVAISKVLFKNIKGTSASKVSVKLDCSKSVGCKKIMLQDINLVGEDGDSTESCCKNVRWSKRGTVVPPLCV
ncbi:polygalacturonase-like [Asparagus officinalis]|uniref:polygalacturonase-like n=1 Tax=Asparagus officinalis TaxID=4686 RepID=UPI00098E198F|nr:polygalacturonase-like [Asparagus officinalis]